MRDVAWGVNASPLHQAIMEGRWLDARLLLTDASAVGAEFVRLTQVQDHPASRALLRDLGLETAFLPGSAWAAAEPCAQAQWNADRLACMLKDADGLPSSPRKRL